MEFWIMVLGIFGTFLISPLISIPLSLYFFPWAVGIPLAGAHAGCIVVNYMDIISKKGVDTKNK